MATRPPPSRDASSPLLLLVLLAATTALHAPPTLAAQSPPSPIPFVTTTPAPTAPSAPLTPPASAPPASAPPASAPPASAAGACPLTGKLPQKPKVVPSRCPAAAELSCCDSCTDLSSALMLVGSTLGDLVTAIDPALLDFVNATIKICDLFAGQIKCAQAMEDLVCAAQCNPDAGRYIKTVGAGAAAAPTMTVCPAFADKAFNSCQGLSVGEGISLTTFIPDAANFISMVAGNIVKVLGVNNFKASIGKTNCFAGTTVTPPYIACCDPLAVPPTCPAGAINTTKYRPFINRPVNSASCQAGTRPPPAPAPAPTPPLRLLPPPLLSFHLSRPLLLLLLPSLT
ncbi:hypothetical protein CLOM_g4680 [Closterium sp. NIES-68]|nr:hypothetical protein CLOM_g4680 [Closterium sp. NIES-68]